MGAGGQEVGFFALDIAEALDEGFAEDAALGQEGVILHQRVAGTFKAGGNLLNLLPFFLGPILHLGFKGPKIEFFGIHLLLNAIEPCQQHGWNGQIGVTGSVRGAVFDAHFVRVSHIFRLANSSRAIAAAKEAAGGGFKTRREPFERVGGRVG